MYPKKVAQDTAKVLQSYLTYQAVRTIIDQLSETNPTLAIWLSHYTSSHSIQDGEAYIAGLMTENKELVLEFLPEMVKTAIINDNTEHRRQLLERLTRTAISQPETSELNLDVDDLPNP